MSILYDSDRVGHGIRVWMGILGCQKVESDEGQTKMVHSGPLYGSS